VHHVRRLWIAPVLLLALLLLSACGSSPPLTSSSTPAAGAGSATKSAPKTTVTTGTTAPATTTTTALPATSTLIPTVADPTNLTVEPVISAGTANPSTNLLTKNLVVGSGPAATASSTVLVKYVGADYSNGKDFTSSTWTDNKATSFSLHTVVPGFAQGIVGMRVGGRREIVIPPALGYGKTGSAPVIQPNETLVFVVDLKAVK